jgi:hypothetical protein
MVKVQVKCVAKLQVLCMAKLQVECMAEVQGKYMDKLQGIYMAKVQIKCIANFTSWKEYCNMTSSTNPWNEVYKLAAGKGKNNTNNHIAETQRNTNS